MDGREKNAVSKDRLFYSIPKQENNDSEFRENKDDKQSLLTYISENIVGKDKIFSGPFGLRRGKFRASVKEVPHSRSNVFRSQD